MKAVYIRNYQDKTCAIGPDLELHNSNYMYSNAPLFYTARIPFKMGETGYHYERPNKKDKRLRGCIKLGVMCTLYIC